MFSMMSSEKVKIITKSNVVIEGVFLPHEDIKDLVDMIREDNIRECLFIYTGKKVTFIHPSTIEIMIGLKIF